MPNRSLHVAGFLAALTACAVAAWVTGIDRPQIDLVTLVDKVHLDLDKMSAAARLYLQTGSASGFDDYDAYAKALAFDAASLEGFGDAQSPNVRQEIGQLTEASEDESQAIEATVTVFEARPELYPGAAQDLDSRLAGPRTRFAKAEHELIGAQTVQEGML